MDIKEKINYIKYSRLSPIEKGIITLLKDTDDIPHHSVNVVDYFYSKNGTSVNIEYNNLSNRIDINMFHKSVIDVYFNKNLIYKDKEVENIKRVLLTKFKLKKPVEWIFFSQLND